MKHFSPRLRGNRRHGAALVIVLAFVVLLTVLVVAFFSRAMSERQVSNSSATQTKVDLLADGAVQTVIGDLKQEIVAGSTNAVLTSGTIYAPIVAAFTVPALALTGTTAVSGTSFAPNVIKRSAYSQPFFSNTNSPLYNSAYAVPNRAAPISSSGTSQNGRFISLARWNQALLLPKVSPGSSTNFTPITSGSNVFVAPDWILVQRSGSNAGTSAPPVTTVPSAWVYSATNSSSVIGRYAYAVYDEGGLLDMNVAGYPGATGTAQFAYKSNLAFADLTQTGLNQAQIDAIVGWRNYGSAQASGAFPNTTIASGSSYYNFVLSNTTGFLTVAGSSAYQGQTDRLFTSRQQLISLLTASGTLGGNTLAATQNALQYLGTSSRAVTAPSFNAQLTNFGGVPYNPAAPLPITQGGTGRPTVVSGSAGNPNTYGNDTLFNPTFTNIRFPSAATITHYNDNGTASTYSVNAGDPLIQRRFSLAKLAWLGYNGPSPGPNGSTAVSGSAIQACFGLVWNSSAPAHWDYYGSQSSIAGSIETLDEVAKEGREPNFFELLQASLAAGSLGRDVNPNIAADKQTPDRSITLQVLQIGANIIDQAVTDNYPRLINISAAFPNGNLVTGVDDVPYISKIIPFCGPIDIHVSGNQSGVWWCFEIWNPHQMLSGTAPGPTNFAISEKLTAAQEYANIKWTTSFPFAGGNTHSLTLPNYSLSQSGTLNFSVAESSGTARLPTLLSVSAASGVAGPTLVATSNFAQNTGTNWIGLFGGDVPQPSKTGQQYPYQYNIYIYGPLRFELDFQDANGVYCPCSIWDNLVPTTTNTTGYYETPTITFGTNSASQNINESAINAFYEKTDPRTDRFGAGLSSYFYHQLNKTEVADTYLGVINGSGNKDWGIDGFETNLSGLTGAAIVDKGASSGNPIYLLGNLSANNDQYSGAQRTANIYYADPDGIVRRGDAMYGISPGDTSDPNVVYGYPMTMSPGAPNPPPSRPIILHRPFKSVAELGYVFRDEPWKTLDFMSSRSADSALLDVFSVSDEPAVVAGKVDINTRNAPVLRSLLSNAAVDSQASTTLSGTTEASVFAASLVNITSTTPFHDLSDLVNRLPASGSNATAALPNDMGATPITADNWGINFAGAGAISKVAEARVKAYRESAVRALGDSTQTRTWNLLINVVAQTGRYTQTGASVQQGFIVEGEKRYWVHLALDRYTGQIVDQQWETVNE